MDENRERWNQRHQRLVKALKRKEDHALAVELFLQQHAEMHSSALTPGLAWSMEDEVWQGVSERAARCIPAGCEHSFVWLAWHLTRCEDITFNLLAAGSPQVLNEGGWLEKVKAPWPDTGNSQSPEQIAALSEAVDLEALRQYRLAVGRRTCEIAASLPVGALQAEVDPARLPRILAEGAVTPEAMGLIDYWGSHKVGNFLHMPGARHMLVHWNEALRMKKKVLKF